MVVVLYLVSLVGLVLGVVLLVWFVKFAFVLLVLIICFGIGVFGYWFCFLVVVF